MTSTYPRLLPSPKVLTLSYLILTSLGLLMILHRLGYDLGKWLALKINLSINYSDWALTCIANGKPAQLLGFIFPAIGLFLYFFSCRLIVNYVAIEKKILGESRKSIAIYFAFLLCITALMLAIFNQTTYFTSLLLIWFALVLTPFRYVAKKFMFLITILKIILPFILLAQLWFMFSPYLKSTPPFISNDYTDIPEQTRINGTYIDNIRFINQKRLAGLLKYDPRHPKQSLNYIENQDFIKLDLTPELAAYLATFKNKFYYDKKYHGLFIYGLLVPPENEALCRVMHTKAACKAITEYFNFNQSQSAQQYSETAIKFAEINHFELYNQSVAGHYFHHHNVFLGPINAHTLGKPQSQTMFLYGWLSTLTLSVLLKYFGGLNVAAYLKISYFFYPLYFSLFALAALYIFRNIWFASLVLATCISSAALTQFEILHIAPGFNPIRHFFDIFVLVSWYMYLFSTRSNTLLLGLAVIFNVLAYLFCKEFGILLYGAFFVAFVVKFIYDQHKKWLDLGIVLLGGCLILCASLFIKLGSNPDSFYYFTGVTIPPTRDNTVMKALFLLVFGYSFILFHAWKDLRWKFLAIFLFTYAQTSLIYYLWYTEPGHLFVFLPFWVLLGIIIFNEITSYFLFQRTREYLIPLLVIIFICNVYLPAILAYNHEESRYFKVFRYHQIYAWDFPTAKFKSTMDPQPFIDAIALIHRYTNNNSMFLISKYDNLLPFLAQRYNAMPFLQTDLSMVTKKELNIATNAILLAKPLYLFVDSDINRNRQGDIFRQNDPLTQKLGTYTVSLGRVLVLNNLTTLFNSVRNNYEPIQTSGLLTVYRRKPI